MSESVRKHSVINIIIYTVCISLAILSIFPFWVMLMNATRSTFEIQQSGVSLLPSSHLMSNMKILLGKNTFQPMIGFINSLMVSTGATLLCVYFSSLTAYALVAYQWRARQAFFAFIIGVMMIPGQVTIIDFYKFIYMLEMTNSFIPLMIPAIASPTIVFFMRQYLISTLSIDIVNSGRIDGANEFYIFNTIILPIMKPAIATQAIFVFVANWNNLFLPLIILIDKKKYTMPIMVSLLRGDIYRTEYGSIYLALSMSVLPLFVIYFLLSRYIIAGVALGGVKE